MTCCFSSQNVHKFDFPSFSSNLNWASKAFPTLPADDVEACETCVPFLGCCCSCIITLVNISPRSVIKNIWVKFLKNLKNWGVKFMKNRWEKFMKNLKNWGVSALARHFASSSSRSSWLCGRSRHYMGQEGLFRGGGIFEERKSQFCPHILKLSADFKLLVGPNGRLMNPVKRQFANKGFSRARASPQQEQLQKKFCQNRIYKSFQFVLPEGNFICK